MVSTAESDASEDDFLCAIVLGVDEMLVSSSFAELANLVSTKCWERCYASRVYRLCTSVKLIDVTGKSEIDGVNELTKNIFKLPSDK